MKTRPFLIALLMLGSAVNGTLAQDATPPPTTVLPPTPTKAPGAEPRNQTERPGHPPLPPIIGALDADHDQVISTSEIAGAAAALLTLDANKDGKLTGDELHPKPPQDSRDKMSPRGPRQERDGQSGPRGKRDQKEGPPRNPRDGGDHRPPPPLVAALDSDADGKISSDEMKQASANLKTLDENSDGQLTKDELRPPLPPQDCGPDGGDEMPPPPEE